MVRQSSWTISRKINSYAHKYTHQHQKWARKVDCIGFVAIAVVGKSHQQQHHRDIAKVYMPEQPF